MEIKTPGTQGDQRSADDSRIVARCHVCRREGTLDSLNTTDVLFRTDDGNHYLLGERRCPARDCGAAMFVVWDPAAKQLLRTYPPELIDFDTTDVPEKVVSAMEEAIVDQSQECWVSAAVMVRKTIEAVCDDKGAKGEHLMDRIDDLGNHVTLPKEFIAGLHDLRLLGNDAAHIEARYYDEVGEEEATAGIAVAKKLIESVYQYDAAMKALAALKRGSGDASTPATSS